MGSILSRHSVRGGTKKIDNFPPPSSFIFVLTLHLEVQFTILEQINEADMVVPKTKEDSNAYRIKKTKLKSENSTAEERAKDYVVQKINKWTNAQIKSLKKHVLAADQEAV